jgi:hypothetical protein
MIVSYTTLEMVAKRNYDCAIKKHLGMEYTIRDMLQNGFLSEDKIEQIEQAINQGKEIHQRIEDQKLKLHPKQGDGDIYEQKFEVELTDWLRLNGVMDVYRPNEFAIDWKVSKNVFSTMQLKVYGLASKLMGSPIKEAYLVNITPDLKIIKQKITLINDSTHEEAYNWVLNYATELNRLLQTA